ncbi:hypothetical protein [Streptomyces cirratus]|uniref:hypothetical protein n=1 Tax=Streptomyces cirratus TaxID=68187 RepID=UPI003609CC64
MADRNRPHRPAPGRRRADRRTHPHPAGRRLLQAVTVQYQILDALDVDLSMDELLHGGTLDELAAVIAERADETAVAALTGGEPR